QRDVMPRLRLIVLALALSACSGAPSASPIQTFIPPGASAASSGACVDPDVFAEDAESVMVVLQGVTSALKQSNVDQAKTAAGTAATGLRNLADLVNPAQPEAATDFRTAATELDSAVAQFPGGQSL